MDASKDNSANDVRCRKFGLPNWMVNNIERLNFVTDFEQYACSPPENEGFLSEHDNHEFHDASEGYCPVVEPPDFVDSKPKVQLEDKCGTEVKQPLCNNTIDSPTSPSFHSILSSIKHEEFFSSPDSTPCATPEPSPAPRRRLSGQQDTVQTNPGKWFYLGTFKKQEQNLKGQYCNVKSNKITPNASEKISEESVKQKDSCVKSKKDGIKLVISNFDMNAISPTSW